MKPEDLNPLVDKYLIDGCMRCKYGATPQCKVLKWTEILETLRQIVLESGLKEEIKWGVPVYTKNGKNILNISALNNSANLGFFKGALMKDPNNLLEQQGNIQLSRIMRFTDIEQLIPLEDVLKAYIHEAIEVEESGKKIEPKTMQQILPDELLAAFQDDPLFQKSFEALTPGRQRAYIVHFEQAKQSKTRIARIEKYKELILNGIGLHDHYKSGKQ